MIKAPVLLITFNRPKTTQIVFNAIKKARPKKLYIFNDGPRSGNIGDIDARKLIEEIVKKVNWDCDVSYFISDENLGCGYGVSSAISWAFEKEEKLIILEDDCVPAVPFFEFCEVLLDKYKDDTRISMISGNNYTSNGNSLDYSYLFSTYGHIWGWATWKRVWDRYDYEMSDWELFKKERQLRNVFTKKKEVFWMEKVFDRTFSRKEKGTWDFQFFYQRVKENGLSIIPQLNLVTNIGEQGVHTDKRSSGHYFPASETFKIIKEPQFVLCDKEYDKYHFQKNISKRTPFFIRAIRKVIRLISN